MTQWQKATAASIMLLVVLSAIAGCGGTGSSGSSSATPTSASKVTLATWSISCPSTTLTSVNQTTQCKATATYSDWSTQDQTSQTTWSSSDASVAPISSSGVVTAKSNGQSRISGTYGINESSLTVTVDVPLTMTDYSGGYHLTPYSYLGYRVTGNIEITLSRPITNPVPSRVRAEWQNSMVGGSITYTPGATQLHFDIDQDTVSKPNFTNSPTDYLRLIDVNRQVVVAKGTWLWKNGLAPNEGFGR